MRVSWEVYKSSAQTLAPLIRDKRQPNEQITPEVISEALMDVKNRGDKIPKFRSVRSMQILAGLIEQYL